MLRLLVEKECNFKEHLKPIIIKYIDDIFLFFENRSKYSILPKIIEKLYDNLSSVPLSNNDTQELMSIIRTMNINEENLKQIKNYEDNINLDNHSFYDKKSKEEINHNDKFQYLQTIAKSNNFELSTKISLETSFAQTLLKEYLLNFKKSIKSIRSLVSSTIKNNTPGCNVCINSKTNNYFKYNFKPNVNSFKILKNTMNQYQLQGREKDKELKEVIKENQNDMKILDDIMEQSICSKKDSKFFEKNNNTIIINNNIKITDSDLIKNKGSIINKSKFNQIKISQISLVQTSKLSKNSIYKIQSQSSSRLKKLNNISNNNQNYKIIDEKIKELDDKLTSLSNK